MARPRSITSLVTLLLSALVRGQSCVTNTQSGNPPNAGAGVALKSYSYCGGALTVTAYVENVNYDKSVQLYYSDDQGQVTSQTVVSLGYQTSISGTNFETWGATAQGVNVGGIQNLVNITFQALDIHKTYSQQLNVKVVASGTAPPSKPAGPKPYASPSGLASDISSYLAASASSQAGLSKALMFNNINVAGSANGTVIAAQSYQDPNYAYNWVRDASLTMDVVASLYDAATSSTAKAFYSSILFGYAGARKGEQNDQGLQTGFGEPKFNLDNSVFTGPWGRPQNDGPATSAITLMNFANSYLKSGGSTSQVQSLLWNGPVKADLLYVAQNWQQSSFDIWEEESATHYYNYLVYHRAMSMCAAFATQMGDSSTSSTCASTASAIAPKLSQFWDAGRGYILYSLGPVQRGKSSFLDIATILGVIHGYNGDNLFNFNNDQVLATAYSIATNFLFYPIAAQHTDNSGAPLGIPIGRYPEDVYTGTGTADNGGNPWFLTTTAMAELFYRAATAIQASGSLAVTATSQPFWGYFAPSANLSVGTYASGSPQTTAAVAALQGWGDAFMRLVKYHGGSGGHLSEEFNRNSGFMQGAADLTWSYAGLLTAAFARAQSAGDSAYITNLANLGF